AQPFVDTPNDVLRRVLELNVHAKATKENPSTPLTSPAVSDNEHDIGALAEMIRKGDLTVGEKLVWARPRLGRTHFTTVTAGGRMRLDGGNVPPFKTPSGAAQALSGHAINGWLQWRRARDGVLLQDLR
ncbi:hypothetical protein ABZ234_29720, partial [Nocardiopsis sp. NPDC006198]|uniref:restriction system modified-DNA reader domain-containing protein n=1 Tax=Nocardiopsis sp. NPDC006198 TaxID=3154472 RepID=UPI0033BC8438